MSKPTIRAVQRETAHAFGLPLTAMTVRCRDRYLIPGRQAAMYLAWKLCGKSIAVVARGFRRDHTTILHAASRVLTIHRHDPAFHRRLTAARAAVAERRHE